MNLSLFSDAFLERSVPERPDSLWDFSKYEHWQKQPNKAKGITAEHFVADFLEEAYEVEIDRSTGTTDYDLFDITNQQKIEVKLAFSAKNTASGKINADHFIWSHVSPDKNFDILVLLGINHELDECVHHRKGWRASDDREEIVLAFFTKAQVQELINTEFWNRQSGGNKLDNSDYLNLPRFFKDTDYLKDYRNYPHSKNIS